MTMHALETISLLVMCFVGLHLASDCFHSEHIECTCDVDSVSCSGLQQEFSEVQELLVNVSNIYSTTDLLYLVLNIKNLTFPPEFTFNDFKLKNLSLGNGLQSLHDDLFAGIDSTLISLNLHYNNIEFFNNRPFSHLYKLTELKFDFNELSEINSGLFFNLSKLEFLSLVGNNLHEIDNNLLEHLPVIQELDLSNNYISSISDIDIKSSTLVKLVAQNCSFNGSLVRESLQGLTNLEYADFSANQLIGVDSYALSDVSQLKTLNLSNNRLEKLETNAFSSLYNLKSLDMKNNKLSFIKATSFLNLTNLKYLDLSGNMLEAVLHEYTLDLYSLENINLKNNNIKIITAGTFSSSINLQELFLKGNAWDCTCELSYFVDFLVNNSHTIKIEDINELNCASPSTLRGTPLISIDFAPLNCDYKEETEEDYDYESSETESTKDATTVSMNSTAVYSTTENMNTTHSPDVLSTDDSATNSPDVLFTANTTNSSDVLFTITNSPDVLFTANTTNSPTVLFTDSTSFPSHYTEENHLSTEEINFSTNATVLLEGKETSSITLSSSSQSTADTTLIKVTTASVPKVVTDLSVKILDYSVLGKDFCIRWLMSGLTSISEPSCSVKIKSISGSRLKNLKCPKEGNEIQQCISSEEVYGFCINIYVKNMRKGKACSEIPVITTTQQTLESVNVSSEITSTFFSITTELNDLTKSTSMVEITRPSLNDKVIFKVTTFDVIFNYFNSSASLKWIVSKNEPETICNLKLMLTTFQYNHTEGIFKCSNNTYRMKNIKEQETFKICLVINHEIHKTPSICKSYSGLSYELKSSRTKDDGYKNSSLIAVVCLLIIVVLILIVIIMKKLLKKRIEADRYNVYAEEQNVKKRMSSQFQQEPCVRYSYTLKEQGDI